MSPDLDPKNKPPDFCPTSIWLDSVGEDRQLFPYLDLSPNSELLSQGWERRFMAGPDRLEEANQLYRELGYEVLNERVLPTELNEICKACQTLACAHYVVIYTRKLISSKSERI